MRYYALDDLADPIHRRTLTVAQETRVNRQGPVVERCRAQGGLLVYLYYSLENRPAHYRAILSLISAVRRTTSRLPKRVMYWLAWSIALGVYWPLARLSLVFDVLGRRNVVGWIPLHDYRRRSIRLMALDAFDRFATPLERRYSRSEVRSWLERHGLQPRFSESSPFWVAYAEKP